MEEIEQWLLYSVAPDIRTTVESIGKSFENRDIWSVSIGDESHPKERLILNQDLCKVDSMRGLITDKAVGVAEQGEFSSQSRDIKVIVSNQTSNGNDHIIEMKSKIVHC